jgi:hypothetical protein
MSHILRFANGLQVRLGTHAAEILADIPNYTDVAPIVQISDVIVSEDP